MVSTNFNMNFIFDEWMSDKHIASKMKEKLTKQRSSIDDVHQK